MKYYDSNVGKIRDTLENEQPLESYTSINKRLTKARDILMTIVIPIMAITVMFQIVWFNIVLHTILCSAIISLCLAMLICDIIRNDKKAIINPICYMTFWGVNLIINIIKYAIDVL